MKTKLVTSLLVALLVMGIIFAVPSVFGATVVRCIPSVTELGDSVTMPDVTGTTFKVAVVVEGVLDFYGFDIQMNWDKAYITHVSHVTTIPVEDYPAPNSPSPYAGALHQTPEEPPTKPVKVKDIVSESGGIPDADPSTYAWFVYAAIAPAVGQDGNATIVVFTFRVVDQPWSYQPPVDVKIHFVATSLSNSGGGGIVHTAEDLTIRLWQRVFTYAKVPKLDVNPDETKNIPIGGTFTVDVSIMDIDDGPLSPFWDVAGFDIYMHFDPTLIKANSISVDPTGWFTAFWPGGLFIAVTSINNTKGEVEVAFLGIPGEGGTHTPPFGIGKLFTVTFESIYESDTYPPPSCPLGLSNPPPRPMPNPLPPPPDDWPASYFMTDMAGFPHPERPMSPWNGLETSPPIPHVIENATYIAKFKPPGRWIDLITQYPEGYNGRGPGEASDAFGPQATVKLIAEVTYNFNPVQMKLVTFEIWHGEYHWVLCNTTDENGIAYVSFGIPWPCDNPEGRVFGTWDAQASVEIREVFVRDSITWEVGYLINIVSVEPQPDDIFAIDDHLSFKVTYNSISHQDREAWFSIVVYDDLDVPIAWFIVGPITVHYGSDVITIECKTVPKHTFVGLGHVYTNILYLTPDHYTFLQYCPQDVIEIGLTV
jgi:hypothetical protein